jgi:hypothetical protein
LSPVTGIALAAKQDLRYSFSWNVPALCISGAYT